MNRRHVVPLLICAAIVYACAPRNRASAIEKTATTTEQPQFAGTTSTSGALALTLSDSSDARATMFAFEVKNTGKRTEVRFVNGKTHDFVVVDDRDREVWRWSTGRLFTQALQTRQLKSGDAVRYEAKWETAQPGTYRVIAQLNSDTNPVQLEREFVVR